MHNVDCCCAVFLSFSSFACRTLHATIMPSLPSHHISTTTKPKDLLCRIIFIIMITVVISTICKGKDERERKRPNKRSVCQLLYMHTTVSFYRNSRLVMKGRVSWVSIQVLLMIMMTAAAMSIRKHTVEKRGIKWYAFIGNRVLSSNKKSIIMVFNQACFLLHSYILIKTYIYTGCK